MRALPPDAFFWNMVPNETAYDFYSKATAYVDGWVVDKSPRAYLAEKQVRPLVRPCAAPAALD